MLIKQLSFSGTTSDWRGRNVVFCCKGSTCLPPFLLLLYLSHQYRYTHCCTTTAWPSTSVPLASKYSGTSSGQEEVCSSSPTHTFSAVCLPSVASSEPIVLSADISTYSCPFAYCLRPQPCQWPTCVCVCDPTSQCIQMDCSCWPAFLPTTCPESLTVGQWTKINAFCANSPATKKVATASIMGTYTVPKMLVFHLTSGWRRCGGRGQIRNRLVCLCLILCR